MKISFKSIIAIVTVVFACLSASAAEKVPGVTFLKADGSKMSFSFESNPKITMTSTGVTVTTDDADLKVDFTFEEVSRYYFEDEVTPTTSGVKAIEATRPLFTYADGVLSVGGLAKGEKVSVVSVSGVVYKTASADTEGTVSVDIRNAATGIYIFTTASGVSFKISKK